MKTFKRFSAAIKHAESIGTQTILKVADLYIVMPADRPEGMTEFAVLTRADGTRGYFYHGHVSVKHLKRLGNANWAQPK